MANTISISPKPGIKCFPANVTYEEILWTGESIQCVCNHHIEQHCTRDHCDQTINSHCHGNNELCNCKYFMAHSIRLSHSNAYKMVTKGLADDFEVPEIYRTQTMR